MRWPPASASTSIRQGVRSCSAAYSIGASLAAALAVIPAAAAAQTIDPRAPTVNNSVSSRTAIPALVESQATHPEDAESQRLQPIGARFGSFVFYPRAEAALTYNDNIYALADRTGDVVARLSPSADVAGDLGLATMNVRASLDRFQYLRHATENRTDWGIGGNARAEPRRAILVYADGGYSHAHEDRGDPNQAYTDRRPTSYYLGEAGLGFSSEATRLRYGADLSLRSLDFQDSAQIGGGTTNNDDRDRSSYRAAARLGFELSPGYVLLARGNYERVAYAAQVDDGGYDRDADGFRRTLGVRFELGRLVTGEVFGGYLRRSFADPRFGAVGRAVYGSSLSWAPTTLMTITLTGDRTVQETIVAGYSGFLSTNVHLKVVHELLRTLTLNAGASYGRDDYLRARGAAVSRRGDDDYAFDVGGRYLLNRSLYAGVAYDWSRRSSNVVLPGIQFSRDRITATLGLQL